jgi:hypothetical protein
LIIESTDVQRELNVLLRQDSALLSKKLDFACAALTSISDRIETLAPLSRALNAQTDALSEQAVAIVKYFDQSGTQRLTVLTTFRPPMLGFEPSGKTITVTAPRFLEDDISSLQALGLLRLVDRNGSGEAILALTRLGSSFAAECPPVSVEGES